MALFILFSCSGLDENILIETNEPLVNNGDEEIHTKSANTTDNVLGFSYDATGEYLDRYSIRRSVIDLEKLRAYSKKSIITNDEVTGENKYYYGLSSYEYIKEITNSTKFNSSVSGIKIPTKYGTLGFAGTFSYDNSKYNKHALSTKYCYASADICKDVRWLQIAENIDFLRNFLDDKFVRDVDNLISPDQFVRDYGTHVLTDITIGGILRIIFSSSIIKEDNERKRTDVVKSGFNATLNKIGLSADINKNISKNTSISGESKNLTLHIRYKAGDGVDGVYDMEKDYPIINKFSWEKSVNASNAGLTKINWEKAYPIYEFISDPVKKQKVKDAVIRYIENNQFKEPLKLVPIYNILTDKKNYYDDWFTTKWDDAIRAIASGDRYVGVLGYIHPNKTGDAIPFYSAYGEKNRDHWYTTDKADYDYWTSPGRKNQKKGILGYVYSTKSNTQLVPLYRVFGKGPKNHWYSTDWNTVNYWISKGKDEYKGISAYIYPAD